MNRNRFSAVATISVPTLGIKGKKLGEKERYIETIDPAPSTPAGEPLGEIEVEVSEEVAQRLKKGWSVEVVKAEPTATLLLETTFPQEIQGSGETPVASVESAVLSHSSQAEAKANEPSETQVYELAKIPKTKDEPTLSAVAETSLAIPSEPSPQEPSASLMDRNVQAPLAASTTQPKGSSETLVASVKSVTSSNNEQTEVKTNGPLEIQVEESSRLPEAIDEPSSQTVAEASLAIPSESSPQEPSAPLMDRNAQAPSAASTTQPKGSSETLVASVKSVSPSNNEQTEVKTNGPLEIQVEESSRLPEAIDVPSSQTVAEASLATPSAPSPQEPSAPLMDRNVQTPAESTPSLFRSRSFAALIDISVACSFFVLGLLLFPNPPRIMPFVLGALYLLTKDSLGILNGQSIGKKVMRLRAVNKRQRTLAGDYKVGLMRNLSWLVAPIEFAILYVREDEKSKGRRLGDDWAETQVIKEERPKPRKSKWLP